MSATPPDDPALSGIGPRGAWLALRALHILDGEGWARYVGATDRPRGHHLIDLGTRRRPHWRLLYTAGTFWADPHPGEAVWYLLGQADARSQASVVDALRRERTPSLLSVELAAAALGVGRWTLKSWFRTDRFYPIYVIDPADHRTRRHVFAHQVTGRWDELRPLLPDLVDAAHLHVPPTPRPWPVDPGLRAPRRQREALSLGHTRGWFRMVRQATPNSSFTVQLPDGGVRVLPVAAVQPWLLGVADANGRRGAEVAYRDWLG